MTGQRLQKKYAKPQSQLRFIPTHSVLIKVSDASSVKRTATDCRVCWIGDRHPKINHSEWAALEVTKLSELVSEVLKEKSTVDWVEVAKQLGVRRVHSLHVIYWYNLKSFRQIVRLSTVCVTVFLDNVNLGMRIKIKSSWTRSSLVGLAIGSSVLEFWILCSIFNFFFFRIQSQEMYLFMPRQLNAKIDGSDP